VVIKHRETGEWFLYWLLRQLPLAVMACFLKLTPIQNPALAMAQIWSRWIGWKT